VAEKFKIRKGDQVIVLTGRDKGKKGEVLRMVRAANRAVVAGVNMVARHTKPGRGTAGGIVRQEAPLQVSNLALIDPKDGKATRVGYKFIAGGGKVRYAKRSGEILDR